MNSYHWLYAYFNNYSSVLNWHIDYFRVSYVQIQKAVSALFSSKEILPFGFAGYNCIQHSDFWETDISGTASGGRRGGKCHNWFY